MSFLNANLLYICLMLLCLSYPLLNSFESKIIFFKKWTSLFPAILFMMMLFIPWDIYFTSINVWSFNDDYILGLKIFLLPIEEWLFFIIIPFCCVFIHEVLAYFFPKNIVKLNKFNYYLLSIVLLILGVFFKTKLYTCYVFLLSSLLLFFITFLGKNYVNNIIRTYMISLIPFVIVNGILTGSFNSPVVMYNYEEILGLRFLNIPIEDFFYSFSMIVFTIIPYNYINRYLKLN